MSVNKVILVGNVGKDPETRHLESGTTVTRFPFATSEVYRNKEGEKITNTDWHNIVLWRNLAEIADKYVRKGSQLYIEGRIKTRSYTDKDGITKYVTEIVGDNLQLLGRRGDDNDSGQDSRENQDSQNNSADNSQKEKSMNDPSDDVFNNQPEDESDDLPF